MRIEQFDADTGEIIQGAIVLVYNRRKVGDRFFMAFQDALEIIAQDKEMTSEPMRVLMFLFSKLDFENYIRVRQTTIAEKLGMSQPNVSRAMKLLVSKEIISMLNFEGVRCYRLNANYGWKGRAQSLKDHRDEVRERRRNPAPFTVIEGGLAA